MSTKEVAAISIKVLAIWLLVHMILELPRLSILGLQLQHGFGLDKYPYNLFIGLIVTAVVVGSLACFLLLRVSNSVLRALDSDSKSNRSELSQEFILQIAGIYFVVLALVAIPDSIRELYFAYVSVSKHSATMPFIPLTYFFGLLIKCVVGMCLIVGAKRCRVWLYRLRGRV